MNGLLSALPLTLGSVPGKFWRCTRFGANMQPLLGRPKRTRSAFLPPGRSNRAGARAMNSSSPVLPIRFGVFEISVRTGELRKQGLKVKLGPQAFKLLLLLLERPGETRTREELRQQLWASGTFVDFEHSLNKAMHVLR